MHVKMHCNIISAVYNNQCKEINGDIRPTQNVDQLYVGLTKLESLVDVTELTLATGADGQTMDSPTGIIRTPLSLS